MCIEVTTLFSLGDGIQPFFAGFGAPTSGRGVGFAKAISPRVEYGIDGSADLVAAYTPTDWMTRCPLEEGRFLSLDRAQW